VHGTKVSHSAHHSTASRPSGSRTTGTNKQVVAKH
jgi:hypothetical protein